MHSQKALTTLISTARCTARGRWLTCPRSALLRSPANSKLKGYNYGCTKNTSHHNLKLDANSTHPAHSHLDCCSTALLCSICYLLSIICATQSTTYAAHPVIPRPPSLKSQLRLSSIALSALLTLQLCTKFSSSQQPNPRLPDSQSTLLLLLENEALRVITSNLSISYQRLSPIQLEKSSAAAH